MKYIFIILFSFMLQVGLSQNSLFVEEWVVPPPAKELKKPLIFVEFWATWCIPCIKAMPMIEQLKKEFNEEVFFMYLSDEPAFTVNKFMTKKNVSFYSAVDTKNRNIDNYKVRSLPASFILDYEGNIVWEGLPTELTKYKLQQLIRQNNYKKGEKSRVNVDQKYNVKEIEFLTFKHKNIQLEYIESFTESPIIEDSNLNFYFNGNVVQLISYITQIPEKNIQNQSLNQKFYTLKTQYNTTKELHNTLLKFISKELHLSIKEEVEKIETYVLKPTSTNNFLPITTYDFSENKAQYLASDMDIEIDNASVEEMVAVLNQFSEHHFQAINFNKEIYDWNIHFKYNELTIEQLENEYNFEIKVKQKNQQTICIKDL